MKPKALGALVCAPFIVFSTAADAQGNAPALPGQATFTTLAITPFAIEGLTGDAAGNLYTTGRATPAAADNPCPVWRISPDGARVPVGSIPNAPAPNTCNPSGITFDADGNLYVADAANGGQVWKLARKADGTFETGVAFATNVPGTNGIAFDRGGNLWTGDGTTGQGRVWRVSPAGGNCDPTALSGCQEVFRIQPMANGAGVGRQASTLQPPPTAANAQPLVANGVAFDERGDLYVADTARGAIWRVQFENDGTLRSRTGCDTTFPPDTLCMENVFVAHPLLEGADGIALDRAGNVWADANERNAIVVVTQGSVTEVFRNPVNVDTGLRNSADATVGNNHILETPTSPFLVGKRFCTANSDGNRRDNSPNSAGEVNSSSASPGARGKISCMDQPLLVPGLALPVR
jgi:sugar lactone lactonase YvrE